MTVPEELRYTAEHEWVAIDGTVASVGITDYAQNSLGDVVYVSVPAAGTTVTAGEPCGEVESTKSVSDIYSPVDGEVIEANPEIEDDPGLVNTDPYGAGWLIPMGFEFGVTRDMDPARDRPEDFERLVAEAPFDLTTEIAATNAQRGAQSHLCGSRNQGGSDD